MLKHFLNITETLKLYHVVNIDRGLDFFDRRGLTIKVAIIDKTVFDSFFVLAIYRISLYKRILLKKNVICSKKCSGTKYAGSAKKIKCMFAAKTAKKHDKVNENKLNIFALTQKWSHSLQTMHECCSQQTTIVAVNWTVYCSRDFPPM